MYSGRQESKGGIEEIGRRVAAATANHVAEVGSIAEIVVTISRDQQNDTDKPGSGHGA